MSKACSARTSLGFIRHLGLSMGGITGNSRRPLTCSASPYHALASGSRGCAFRADMLLRMYARWGQKHGKSRVVEKSGEEEAGIKSAKIEIEGRFAYGHLSRKKGTHRIVRQSPFNAKGLRKTSFAGVEAMPLLREESINIDIPEEDLEISSSRAGGKGGQNVNKVEITVQII